MSLKCDYLFFGVTFRDYASAMLLFVTVRFRSEFPNDQKNVI